MRRPEQVVVKRVEKQQSTLNCNILHKQRSIPAPAETGQTTEAHYFSTLLAGYQQATNGHNSFYSNMLHKKKSIPTPAKTSFWKHLLALQERSKHLVTKHLSNIHTVKRVESSEPLAMRQDVTQDTLTESQTDRFRGSCYNT